MSNTTLRQAFKDIADAIRAKGVTGTMSPLQMPSKVASIPSGGSTKYGASIDDFTGDIDEHGVLQPVNQLFQLESDEILGIADALWMYKFFENQCITEFNLPNLTTIGNSSLNAVCYNCPNLEEVDLSSLTTIGDWGLQQAFSNCPNLVSIDLSSLTTINGSMYALGSTFADCTSLRTVDLSHLTSVSGNQCMLSLFNGCTSLETVDLSNLTTVSGSNAIENMFRDCTSLKSLNLSKLTSTSNLN